MEQGITLSWEGVFLFIFGTPACLPINESPFRADSTAACAIVAASNQPSTSTSPPSASSSPAHHCPVPRPTPPQSENTNSDTIRSLVITCSLLYKLARSETRHTDHELHTNVSFFFVGEHGIEWQAHWIRPLNHANTLESQIKAPQNNAICCAAGEGTAARCRIHR